MASDSFALTLWTFHQSEEAEYMASLIRESEQLRMADMIATAFHEPKKLKRFEQDWRKRALVQESVTESTIEQMAREADELRALHESAANKRLVS